MRVLLIGSGGREHALARALTRSPSLRKLYCAPGNAGIASLAECVDIPPREVDRLTQFARDEKIDLVVVGPEEPLVLGLTDRCQRADIPVLGPTREAAMLEGSKVFSKEILRRYRIPTATYRVFTRFDDALDYVVGQNIYPVVLKADGLAAGKGVVIAEDADTAYAGLEKIMVRKAFGDAGARVVVEEFLKGTEVSLHLLTDGRTLLPLEPARDFKKALDRDLGPNTGGMGSYSPAPLDQETYRAIESQILVPIVHAMNREGKPFRGVLYAGLMLTAAGPKVLEFNVRLGDPETQVLLPRLKSDLVQVALLVARGQLHTLEKLDFDDRAAVCVVVASKGYPEQPQVGVPILGLDEADRVPDVHVYHAGTTQRDGRVLTTGGRVLGITGLGATVADARRRAYEALQKVRFDGMHYRRDIAAGV
jgi:phosphoribosylamine--glycine ligase